MRNQVNGLTDIHTILSNERRLGGAIEAERIRLRSGEEYENPVITNIDYAGSLFYSLGFISGEGKRLIVNVNDISLIFEPAHKKIHELKNNNCKKLKVQQKINYLKRLCEVNAGACTVPFVDEVKWIVEDIGVERAKQEVDLPMLDDEQQNIIRIA